MLLLCRNISFYVTVINPCKENNGGCEYMCLLSSAGNGQYSCACPTGHPLHSDGRSCLGTFIYICNVQQCLCLCC